MGSEARKNKHSTLAYLDWSVLIFLFNILVFFVIFLRCLWSLALSNR